MKVEAQKIWLVPIHHTFKKNYLQMKCVGLLPTAINEGSLATSTTTKKH